MFLLFLITTSNTVANSGRHSFFARRDKGCMQIASSERQQEPGDPVHAGHDSCLRWDSLAVFYQQLPGSSSGSELQFDAATN